MLYKVVYWQAKSELWARFEHKRDFLSVPGFTVTMCRPETLTMVITLITIHYSMQLVLKVELFNNKSITIGSIKVEIDYWSFHSLTQFVIFSRSFVLLFIGRSKIFKEEGEQNQPQFSCILITRTRGIFMEDHLYPDTSTFWK